jgi:hypothetical protein
MKPKTSPDKHEIRLWLARRCLERSPLPDREQIQRELGWIAREPDCRLPTDAANFRPADAAPDGP